jgi:hypothetical protein
VACVACVASFVVCVVGFVVCVVVFCGVLCGTCVELKQEFICVKDVCDSLEYRTFIKVHILKAYLLRLSSCRKISGLISSAITNAKLTPIPIGKARLLCRVEFLKIERGSNFSISTCVQDRRIL